MANKTLTIIKREYLSRVRKKSFVVMTILGPLLLASLMIVPVFLAQLADREYHIAIVDDTTIFYPEFIDDHNVRFTPLQTDLDSAILLMKEGAFDAVLHIPVTAFQAPATLRLFSEDPINIDAKLYCERILQQEFEYMKLAHAGIDPEVIKATETEISIQSFRLLPDGHQKSDFPELSRALGLVSGILIYFFIFLFGTQVMRGVMEEKSNRVVEIIVSSVKPFQLMMGKIVGLAMVGLTQFVIWILLSFAIVTGVRTAMPEIFEFTPASQTHQVDAQTMDIATLQQQAYTINQHNSAIAQVWEALNAINFAVMIFAFIFYFLAGYLLYAALFAAIGSAVDNEADTQQFMLPVTIPLVLSVIMASTIMNNPSGPVAFWMSIIPFTSPISMMMRIPFGVPFAELGLSIVLLILGFLGTTWLASKIYRTGILMYGKKISYHEIWKWLK